MRLDNVTPSQIRAARSILGWSSGELVERSGVSAATIKRLLAADDVEKVPIRMGNFVRLIAVLEDAGAIFFADEDHCGVMVRKDLVLCNTAAASDDR